MSRCLTVVSACAMCAEFEAEVLRQAKEYQQQMLQQAQPHSTDGLLDRLVALGMPPQVGYLSTPELRMRQLSTVHHQTLCLSTLCTAASHVLTHLAPLCYQMVCQTCVVVACGGRVFVMMHTATPVGCCMECLGADMFMALGRMQPLP